MAQSGHQTQIAWLAIWSPLLLNLVFLNFLQ